MFLKLCDGFKRLSSFLLFYFVCFLWREILSHVKVGSLTKHILRLINHFLSSFCVAARKLILQISFVILTDKWE